MKVSSEGSGSFVMNGTRGNLRFNKVIEILICFGDRPWSKNDSRNSEWEEELVERFETFGIVVKTQWRAPCQT
jgi:hypothetical protein